MLHIFRFTVALFAIFLFGNQLSSATLFFPLVIFCLMIDGVQGGLDAGQGLHDLIDICAIYKVVKSFDVLMKFYHFTEGKKTVKH